MKRKIMGIIQARMGASRLPNKMMLHLHGYPIIEWVYRRSNQAKYLDDLIVAIPSTSKDDPLATFLTGINANVFRGSEENVVQRYYSAAAEGKATHIVRICADNPLICGSEIDHLITFYFQNPCDYAYNHIPRGNRYPDGLGAEIISFPLLETIRSHATRADQKEHVMNYLWDNSNQFVMRTFDPPDELIAVPGLTLDVDSLADYDRLLKKNLRIDMSPREIVQTFSEEHS